MRDTKSILAYAKQMQKRAKESLLNKVLRKEVNVGNMGTQDYVIKEGSNKGKVATKDTFQ